MLIRRLLESQGTRRRRLERVEGWAMCRHQEGDLGRDLCMSLSLRRRLGLRVMATRAARRLDRCVWLARCAAWRRAMWRAFRLAVRRRLQGPGRRRDPRLAGRLEARMRSPRGHCRGCDGVDGLGFSLLASPSLDDPAASLMRSTAAADKTCCP